MATWRCDSVSEAAWNHLLQSSKDPHSNVVVYSFLTARWRPGCHSLARVSEEASSSDYMCISKPALLPMLPASEFRVRAVWCYEKYCSWLLESVETYSELISKRMPTRWSASTRRNFEVPGDRTFMCAGVWPRLHVWAPACVSVCWTPCLNVWSSAPLLLYTQVCFNPCVLCTHARCISRRVVQVYVFYTDMCCAEPSMLHMLHLCCAHSQAYTPFVLPHPLCVPDRADPSLC